MKLESSSQYVKFENVGDSIRGRFLSYEKKPDNFNPGKMKGEVMVRTKEGVRIISCTTFLDKIFSEHAEKLDGKVITVTFVRKETHKKDGTKYMQPMKVFEVDDGTSAPQAQTRPQHRTVQGPPPEDDEVSDAQDVDF